MKKKINFVLFHSYEQFFKGSYENLDGHIPRLLNNFKIYGLFKSFDFKFHFFSINKSEKIYHKNGFEMQLYKVNLFKGFIPLEFSFSFFKKIWNLDKSKSEIWHLNTYYYFMFDFILPLLKLKKQKVVVHHRGGGFTFKSSPYTFFQYFIILPILLRFADKIIVQNKYEYNRLIKYYGLNSKKIMWIPNGIDMNIFDKYDNNKISLLKKNYFDKEDFIISYVGRFEKNKGVENILKILEYISVNQVKNIKICIIGVGSYIDKFKNRIKSKNYDKLVYFSEKTLDQNDLIDFYNISDVLVHFQTKNLYEGSPNVIIEAQSCGLPVIGFDIAGVKDILINKKTGFLIEVNNMEDYINKLFYLYKDRKVLNNMRIKSRLNISKNFEIKFISQKYEKIYNNL